MYSLDEGARDTAHVTPLEVGACDTRCGSGDARDGTPTSTYAAFKGGCWMHRRACFVMLIGHCT